MGRSAKSGKVSVKFATRISAVGENLQLFRPESSLKTASSDKTFRYLARNDVKKTLSDLTRGGQNPLYHVDKVLT